METFKSLRMVESKESIIKKMPNLTDEQKEEAINFFNKYNAFEKEVDWNKWRTLTWEDLKAVITKDRNTKAQTKKKIKAGLEGFVEGKDYDILAEGEWRGEPYIAYIPYTWEASRMIASSAVPPAKLKFNPDLGKAEPIAAKWCTAYNKDSSYWNKHTSGPDFSAFIYLCGETIPTKKIAIELNGEGKNYNCDNMEFTHYTLKKEDGKILHSDSDYINYNYWDFNDNINTFKSDQIPDMKPYFLKALEEMGKRRDILLKARYENTLDSSLTRWADMPNYFPTAEEVKKAVMNNFKPEVWSFAAYFITGKGEINEDFAIREACLSDSVKFMNKGWIDKQQLKDYVEEVGTRMTPYQTLCTLYTEEGPEAAKPFFTKNGLDEIINYYKENLVVRDGVIFSGDPMLRDALTT